VLYTDTSANDSFTAATGTLAGTDANGDSLTYGIAGVIDSDGDHVVSQTSDYGTLTVNTTTGAYSFAPNDAAIEGLKTDASETFTVTVSDGQATTSQTLACQCHRR